MQTGIPSHYGGGPARGGPPPILSGQGGSGGGGGGPAARLNELLDAIRNEFDAVTQDSSMFRMQREEFEHKIAGQINEMNQIQQNIYELERAHQKMKQQYEDEIMRLRRELESRGGASTGSGPGPMQLPSMSATAATSQPQPPLLPASGTGNPSPAVNGMHSLPAPQLSSGGTLFAGGGGANPTSLPAQPGDGGAPGGGSLPQQASHSGSAGKPMGYPMMQPQQQSQRSLPNPPNMSMNRSMMPQLQQSSQHMQPVTSSQSQSSAQQQQQQQSQSSSQLQQQQAQQAFLNQSQAGVTNQPPRPVPASRNLYFGDLEVDAIPPNFKREGPDWLVMFNPKLPRTVDSRLVHSLDHSSVVCCVKFSADGKYLATGCNKSTQVYDVVQGQKIVTLVDGNETEGDLYIRSACFSPDGQFLATGAEDKQIRLWDLKWQTVRTYFTGHEQDIYSLDFSKDGKIIASGSGDRTAKIWDVETSKCVFTLGNDEVGPKDAGVTSVSISPDNRFVAAGSLDRIIRIWDTRSGQFVARLEGHKDSVYSVTFSPDGQSLVSGSLDRTLKVWDLAMAPPGGIKTSCRSTCVGHKDFVLSVAFSPDGGNILSGSKDRFVHLWDPKLQHPLFMLQGHKNSVISVAMSPNGNLFATGSGDCRSRIWSLDPYKPTSQN